MSTNWYSAYDADGEIVATFVSEPDNAEANKPAGSSLLEGQFYPADGYVPAGVFSPYSEQQRLAKQQRPSHPAKWSNQTMAWIDQRSADQAWADVRAARKRLLQMCDWTQTVDAPLSAAVKAAWATYRQALRDITTQPDPFNVTWPTPPQA